MNFNINTGSAFFPFLFIVSKLACCKCIVQLFKLTQCRYWNFLLILVLKNCAKNIPLSILFSKSYYSGAITDERKAALVVPVHKKGDKSLVFNYRPISLTCIIMKVVEIIVRDEIMLRSGHFIDNHQHGFLPSKSCNTQLVDFCDSLA